MRIHRAGYAVILKALFILLIVNLIIYFIINNQFAVSLSIVISCVLLLFVLRFFRCPNRQIPQLSDGQILCPADGKIVTIEEVDEPSIVSGKRLQVSIFMSCWNVHMNWLPVSGEIKQIIHFDGRFTRAVTPKSSDLNEHTAVVVKPQNSDTVLVKQVAGAVARRILTYLKQDETHNAGEELGFIRFGSRVDILLPLDYEVKVKLGQKVVGCKTIIAEHKQ